MSVRASWRGYLKLALVSCPIALYPATSANARVSFRTILNRIKQQSVDSVTGEVVETDDKAKGYEIGKNDHLLIEDHELDALKIESSHTIEIDRFVPREQIDPRYFDSPYYLAPDGKVGQDAFAVIREAMRGKEMVGIGRVVLSSRERPVVLEPFGKGVRAFTLHYPYEVRSEEAFFESIADVEVSGELLEMAESILDSKAGDFDAESFVDHYEDALVDLLNRKKAGQPPKPAAAAAPPSNVVNLMDALRASMKGDGPKPKAKPVAKAAKANGKTKKSAA